MQTDSRNQLIIGFRNFAKAPQKSIIIKGGGSISDFYVSVQEPMAGCCGSRNKLAAVIIDGEFVEKLNTSFTACTLYLMSMVKYLKPNGYSLYCRRPHIAFICFVRSS